MSVMVQVIRDYQQILVGVEETFMETRTHQKSFTSL